MADAPVDLTGRVVVVTGAGQGLGRSHARMLARRGARVVVNDRAVDDDGPAAERVATEITAAGGQAVAHVGSASDPEAVDGLVATAVDRFGGLDAVVSNAGLAGGGGLADLDVADFDGVVDVHLRGAFLLARSAFRVMADQGHGHLVFTVSSAGMVGNDFDGVAYAAAKAGTYGLMRAVAHEGAAVGVVANAIAPYACTPSTADHLDPRLHRWLRPEVVSPVVAWLVSPACTRTGHVFSVAGGGVSRVFVAVTEGIRPADPDDLTPEAVAAGAERICDVDGAWFVPRDTNEDFQIVFGRSAEAVDRLPPPSPAPDAV